MRGVRLGENRHLPRLHLSPPARLLEQLFEARTSLVLG